MEDGTSVVVMVHSAWVSLGVHKMLLGIADDQPFEKFGCAILAGRLLPNNGYPGIVLEHELDGPVKMSRFQSFIPWQYVIAMHTHHGWPREENARVAMGFAAEIARLT
jgi:hypothetical protein